MSDYFVDNSNIFENYYEILNVESDASIEEISKNYRSMARKHHPDHGGNIEMFELLSRAYGCLSDDNLRKRYDLEYLNNKNEDNKNEHMLDYFKSGFDRFKMENTKPLNKDEINKLYDNVFDKQEKDKALNEDNMKNKIKDIEAERNMYDIEDSDDYFSNMVKENENITINDIYEFMNRKSDEIQLTKRPMMTYDLMENSNLGYSLIDNTNSSIAESGFDSFRNFEDMNVSNVKKVFNVENFNSWKNEKKDDKKLTKDDFDNLLKERKLETLKINSEVKDNFKDYKKTKEIKNFMKIENEINIDDLNIVDDVLDN